MTEASDYFCWVLDEEYSDADRLRWLFDFIYRDNKTLKDESVDYLLSLERHLFRKKPHSGPLSGEFIMEESPSMSELTTAKNFERMISIQATIRDIAVQLRSLCLGEVTEIKGLGEMRLSYNVRIRSTTDGNDLFCEPQITGDDNQRAIYEFINLIGGVHLNNFGICRVCGRFFFGYKRDTQYCSTKCNWRINQRRYRKQRLKLKEDGKGKGAAVTSGIVTSLETARRKKK